MAEPSCSSPSQPNTRPGAVSRSGGEARERVQDDAKDWGTTPWPIARDGCNAVALGTRGTPVASGLTNRKRPTWGQILGSARHREESRESPGESRESISESSAGTGPLGFKRERYNAGQLAGWSVALALALACSLAIHLLPISKDAAANREKNQGGRARVETSSVSSPPLLEAFSPSSPSQMQGF